MPRTPLLLGLLLLAPAAASAQDATAVLAVAYDALEEGDPGRALELARMARALDDTLAPEALVLMGRALLRLERPAAAHRLFRRALDDADPATRRAALSGVSRANRRLATLRLDVHPVDAIVEIDGERVEWERGQRIVLTTPGTHQITARAPGHRPREATVHATSEALAEVHLLLEPGDEDRPDFVRRPPSRPPVERWQSGNLIQTGIGLAGVAASALWAADASQRGTAGAKLELAHAHYELGVSLGLALGGQAHLVGYVMSRGRSGLLLEAGAVAMLTAAAMMTGVIGAATPEPDLRLVSGLFAGGAVSAFGNLVLNRDSGSVALSLVLTSFGLAVTQMPLVFEAIGTQPAGHAAYEQYRQTLPAGADACAQIAAGDTQAGAFRDQMGSLSTTCSRLDAFERTGDIALGVALGSAAIGVGTGIVLVATGDRGDGLDFAIAAGPSSVSATGRF